MMAGLTLFVLLVLAYWPRIYNVMFACLLVLRFVKHVDNRIGSGRPGPLKVGVQPWVQPGACYG